jgi:hypothetical protein
VVVGEGRADDAQVADGAAVEQLARASNLRVVAPHEGLGQHAAFALGDVEDAIDVLGVAGERLLAQHVLAGLERAERPLHVQRVGQRVVDRVDVGIGQQRLV